MVKNEFPWKRGGVIEYSHTIRSSILNSPETSPRKQSMGIGEGDVFRVESRFNSPDLDFSPAFRLENKTKTRMVASMGNTKKVNHVTLANAFMNSNEVINYGLNSNQNTVR